MTRFKQVLSITMAVAALILVNGSADAATKMPVVVSFSILSDIVANVGRDHIVISTLVGPDEDAHVYAPTPKDVRTLASAKVVVINGLGFEGWLERLTDAANYKGTLVVVSDGIHTRHRKEEGGSDADHAAHRLDPHAWQDPTNVMIYTRNIVTALSKADPANAVAYKNNGDAYIQALLALDSWAQAQFAQIADARRNVITSHDAFEYFGAHFKVRFLAPQGVSTESEPSAKDVAMLIRQIREEHSKALFFENMSNPKLLQQISAEVGVKPGGKLYADALSQVGGSAPTYLAMMRFNVTQIMDRLKLE
ncbi:metal ABC transporter substrate-binding protein [Glaciimonas immobilis]|uniref:Zinc/manganese transport system substrate-binding protein n=1 Tax=Glaciimonas immobilis TaxID=728004 RepID=A0A840RRG6_9BURK|nr:metal ABC transporter substrate-binding protein [Glaciimonas immobilis]KAF3997796.1 metal ABC transporter substrate-binding protein [Glaciimonas immobilis]MBB5199578.1 zinc/manganese transport system substrate-binding protein [Glaciimonas immobilis]